MTLAEKLAFQSLHPRASPSNRMIVSPEQISRMKGHAEQTYPKECCGLILGIDPQKERERERKILELYPTINVWDDKTEASSTQNATAHKRYRIEPKEMLQAQQYARTNGWDIIGIYHSHPNHDAVPSEWDRMWAWPEYSYVIVSLRNGVACDVQSWVLDEDHEFLPERLMVLG